MKAHLRVTFLHFGLIKDAPLPSFISPPALTTAVALLRNDDEGQLSVMSSTLPISKRHILRIICFVYSQSQCYEKMGENASSKKLINSETRIRVQCPSHHSQLVALIAAGLYSIPLRHRVRGSLLMRLRCPAGEHRSHSGTKSIQSRAVRQCHAFHMRHWA